MAPAWSHVAVPLPIAGHGSAGAPKGAETRGTAEVRAETPFNGVIPPQGLFREKGKWARGSVHTAHRPSSHSQAAAGKPRRRIKTSPGGAQGCNISRKEVLVPLPVVI